MQDIAVWKLVVDLCFLASVIYFCFRFGKVTTLSQVESVMELETSLRKMIEEAQLAGQSLNDTLLKRQQSLEKALFDMQAAEHRVGRIMQTAEDAVRSLERRVNSAPLMQQNSQQTNQSSPAPLRPAEPPSFETISAEKVIAGRVLSPQTARTETSSSEPPVSPQSEQPAPARAKVVRRNIYGEVIEESAAKPSALSASIERTVARAEKPQSKAAAQPVARRTSEPEVDIQDMYASAEELLRAGHLVESVAEHTRLPLEDVRMLGEIVARQQQEAEARQLARDDDPRLGVLGGAPAVKREVQTL